MSNTLLLRPDEAARELGIGRGKAYELIRSGELPSIRIGRSVRVPMTKLQDWINERAADKSNVDGSMKEERGATNTRPERRRA